MTARSGTFGVSGTAVRDTIVAADGTETQDMGGIYYAIETLAVTLPPGVRLFPVTIVGQDVVDRVRDDWSRFDAIGLDGVRAVPAVNNAVRIEYAADGGRGETQTGGLPVLGWRDVQPWIGRLDAWLWNLVSGAEITQGTFGALKNAFRGEIYLDLHSLCLEPAHGGVRHFRAPPAWRTWVENVTWLQVNEVEAGLLHTGEAKAIGSDASRALAAEVHALGVEGLLVTRGADGAAWYGSDGSIHVADPEPVHAVDPTGCGDVFGAAWFASHRVHGLPVETSLRCAVRAASSASTIRGTRDLNTVLEAPTHVR